MKTATVILVTLTMFTLLLESSTVLADSNLQIGATVNIKNEDKQAMYERMESSEAALRRAKKIAADAIPKATRTQKLTLVAVHTWLVALVPTAGSIHEQIRAAIASESVNDIKAVVVQIDEAVATIKASLDGFNKALSPGEVEDGMNKEVNTVMSNASDCSKTLKTYL